MQLMNINQYFYNPIVVDYDQSPEIVVMLVDLQIQKVFVLKGNQFDIILIRIVDLV